MDYKQYYNMNKAGSSPTTGHHFTRFLKLKNYNPTQGELLIMVNREQNKPSQPNSLNLHQHQNHKDDATETEKGATATHNTPRHRVADNTTTTKMLRPITGESLHHKSVSEYGERATPEQLEEPQENGEGNKQTRIEITTTLPDINNSSA